MNSVQIKLLIILSVLTLECNSDNEKRSQKGSLNYTEYSRLTDPGDNEKMLKNLPDDIEQMCDIANVQSSHITMLSQWKIPRSEWRLARADHHIKDILDTLKVKGTGKLTINRKLNDRILGACTKESIFSTSMLRAKGIPARMRVGYLTNLYSGKKAVAFWRNVNKYGRPVPADSIEFDQYTLYMKKINKAIEHWVAEYWDAGQDTWRIIDIRPEYLQSYGLDVDYYLPDEYFEFGYEAWQKRDHPAFENDAYSEGDLDGKSHIRYQMLMDFYSLLNHDVPGVFDDTGKDISSSEDNEEIRFLRKKYEALSQEEIKELNELANLLRQEPSIEELLDFYYKSSTVKINSMMKDPYSFVYIDQKENKAANNG
jgi:hypothetical protein